MYIVRIKFYQMNKTLLLSSSHCDSHYLLQTLRYKFLAHPDSVYIFTVLVRTLRKNWYWGHGTHCQYFALPQSAAFGWGALLSVGLNGWCAFLPILPSWALKLKTMEVPFS